MDPAGNEAVWINRLSTPLQDTMPALHTLKNRGLKLGLCSNLAWDYAAPIVALLPFTLDAYVWSFDAAAIKPDPIIYERACQHLRCAPGDVLMVGDTMEADFEGPRAFGMQALLLDRKQRYGIVDSIPSLSVLCDMIQMLSRSDLPIAAPHQGR